MLLQSPLPVEPNLQQEVTLTTDSDALGRPNLHNVTYAVPVYASLTAFYADPEAAAHSEH